MAIAIAAQTHTITVLVDNRPGVLARVSGLFARRGYNIESLTVSITDNPNMSRMTIVVAGDADTLEQITKQLHKLIDVHKVSRAAATRLIPLRSKWSHLVSVNWCVPAYRNDARFEDGLTNDEGDDHSSAGKHADSGALCHRSCVGTAWLEGIPFTGTDRLRGDSHSDRTAVADLQRDRGCFWSRLDQGIAHQCGVVHCTRICRAGRMAEMGGVIVYG